MSWTKKPITINEPTRKTNAGSQVRISLRRFIHSKIQFSRENWLNCYPANHAFGLVSTTSEFM